MLSGGCLRPRTRKPIIGVFCNHTVKAWSSFCVVGTRRNCVQVGMTFLITSRRIIVALSHPILLQMGLTSLSHLLTLANTESNSAYLRRCKQQGIKPHPARFPQGFAQFFIKFLTDEGDLVVDPFAGSNTTGIRCRRLRTSMACLRV